MLLLTLEGRVGQDHFPGFRAPEFTILLLVQSLHMYGLSILTSSGSVTLSQLYQEIFFPFLLTPCPA